MEDFTKHRGQSFWVPEDFGFEVIFYAKKWRKGHYELIYFSNNGKWLLRKKVIDHTGKPTTLVTFYLHLPESYKAVKELFTINNI